ncbi:hypothetical protein JX265_011251 [Neoarthrinium moseri]|uniref:U6 small nuclear RNA (adenine-(43)-N(6))-methyltransferase n=1 Tax=Neoarthrinium moseri TaxID=1658444 RepID=A0A9Q0AKU9_9PEZI|nr:uncharacterized protein JN550_010557 [Neoarthrinium moseri]KAI1845854.1 hypothetical protein JX266_007941 [Neoarthrinium moseri]KAI1857516.1 hypothetical protein JX265_011251 [Neoarthrinium moseri]KAI1862092.1 hypothetical protein JN550_010557 [Neoarthrinium moseri]
MDPAEGDPGVRGVKRKHPGDGGKLTFSQRLAAARKAVKLPDERDDESEVSFTEVSKTRKDTQQTLEHERQDARFCRLYTGEIDFQALGEKDRDFCACLKDGQHLDFTDPSSVMQLTRTLLRLDFGLEIDLPDDRLCPPVPNRHNYILWIKSLLDTTSQSFSDAYQPGRKVTGLDIGTGASAIYPLLGCTQRPSWSFIGTDIDEKSLEFAQRNVELNNLGSRIRIVKRSAKDKLISLDELDLDQIDFVMTNPPFYTSESELVELAKQKSKPPNSACTGASSEMVCDGGEVGFFKRMFDESLILRERVQWYTTMLGKQSSLDEIVQLLKDHDIGNYALTEFVQGKKTRRWAVGWSFVNRRPGSQSCRRFEPSAGKKLLPPWTEFTAAARCAKSGGAEQLENIFWTQLEDVTDGLDLVSWNMDEDRLRVVGFANQNVWSRSYRRSKDKGILARPRPAKGKADKTVLDCPFGFSISINAKQDQSGEEDEVRVVVRWLQGTDYGLFESFFGMLRNALLNVVS